MSDGSYGTSRSLADPESATFDPRSGHGDQPTTSSAGTQAARPSIRPRELRRQRIAHLTNDWSLVSGSTGALGVAVRPTVRRAADVDAQAPDTLARGVDREGMPVATPAAPPSTDRDDDLAVRFMTELSRSVRSRPVPLPTTFQPMADHITGGRQVMLATDDASRRALRSVGKIAATSGDTIHLDVAATGPSRMNHVLAHELTHVANPSPVARFFDDVVDSPEERRAEATAKIMTRSPLAPASSVLGAPGAVARRATRSTGSSTSTGSNTIRRSLDTSSSTSTAPSTPGTIDAASMAASITGRTIQRQASGSGSNAPSGGSGGSLNSNVIRRAIVVDDVQSIVDSSTPSTSGSGMKLDSAEALAWFADQLERNADTIFQLLSDRIVIDLERRGGRMWGGI
jgi:hypothetical protein